MADALHSINCQQAQSLNMTTIRYFIPEDGDDELHPNVFLAPKPRQPGTPPTLQSVKDAFPLPGHYHFRFKSPLFPGADREKGAMAVWMDVTVASQPVPTWKNTIVAKVTRLSMEEDDDDDDDDFGHHHQVQTPVPAPAPPARAPPSHASSASSGGAPSQASNMNLFDAPSATPAPQPNLFDSHAPSASTSSGSLLDFGASPPAAAPAPPHTDFLGMTAPPPTPQQPMPPQQQYHHQQQQQQQQQMYQQQQQAAQRPGSFNSYSQQAQPFGDIGTPWN